MEITAPDNRVEVRGEDQGVGLEPASITPKGGRVVGGAGMRERAWLIDADLELASSRDDGTTVKPLL